MIRRFIERTIVFVTPLMLGLACSGVDQPSVAVEPTPLLGQAPPQARPIGEAASSDEAAPLPVTQVAAAPSPPADSGPLPGALPVVFEGTFVEPEFGPYPMVLTVERVQGNTFTGQLHWPTFETITSVTGEFIFDFAEAERWSQVEGFNPDGGVGYLFTETEYISGEGTLIDGWYYGYLGGDGTMKGVWYSERDAGTAVGSFDLTYRR